MILNAKITAIKSVVYFLILFFCFVAGCSSKGPQRKPYSEELGKINSTTCQEIYDLYKMRCSGMGLGLESSNTRVHNLYINFDAARIVDRDQARRLVLDVLDIYLKNIRENSVFLEQFAVTPFDEANIDLSIFFYNPDGSNVFDPYIGVASSVWGSIQFDTDDPEKKWTYKSNFEETLEEARRIVQEQNDLKPN